MINEFSVNPKPQNKSAHITCGSFMAAFVACVVLYMTLDKYKGIIGLAALVFLTVGISIYTRYISVKYYYDVTFDENSKAVFVVRQITGKRQSTLCCIYLSSVTDIKRETKEERKKHKTPFGMRKYNYTPTLIPSLTYRISSKSRIESCEICVEITDEYAKLFTEYVEEAKELARVAEETDLY